MMMAMLMRLKLILTKPKHLFEIAIAPFLHTYEALVLDKFDVFQFGLLDLAKYKNDLRNW